MSRSFRRTPQRAKGERRVAEILEAAATVIAEVGYETCTMTAIAERAGASIGTVYQYFPNKEAVVRALRLQYGDEIGTRWMELAERAHGVPIPHLVDGMFSVLVDFWERRPAYFVLLSVPTQYRRDPGARNRLRSLFATLFRSSNPNLHAAEAFRVANVALQIVKGLQPLWAQATKSERPALLQEFKAALTAYLTARLAVT
ncbi:MAG TPA: TetR/AcrR family transcriptional regulator [Candidatus Xenobia bacterium]|jgi:AcrR family transcriptional regulator